MGVLVGGFLVLEGYIKFKGILKEEKGYEIYGKWGVFSVDFGEVNFLVVLVLKDECLGLNWFVLERCRRVRMEM